MTNILKTVDAARIFIKCTISRSMYVPPFKYTYLNLQSASPNDLTVDVIVFTFFYFS